MKVEMNSKKDMILYLPNIHIDFNTMEEVEKDLKNILLKLKYNYAIEVQGFYEVRAYSDTLYGLILEIDGDRLDYFDYFDGEIDLRIELIEEEFLYEIEDILVLPKDILKKNEIYFWKDKYYLKAEKNINMDQLLEYVDCIHYKKPFLFKEKNKLVG